MKNRLFLLCNVTIFIFFLSFLGCSKNSADSGQSSPVTPNETLLPNEALIPIKPVVKVTQNDYDKNSFMKSFPDTVSLNLIATAYSNNYYSENIKTLLNCYMQEQVKKLGQDVKIFEKIQTLSGCNVANEYILPTYAEKAKYNGKDVWIIQVAYGLSSPALAHFKCYAFGIEKLDMLDYFGCK